MLFIPALQMKKQTQKSNSCKVTPPASQQSWDQNSGKSLPIFYVLPTIPDAFQSNEMAPKRAKRWNKKLKITIMPDTYWAFPICPGAPVHIDYPIKSSKPPSQGVCYYLHVEVGLLTSWLRWVMAHLPNPRRPNSGGQALHENYN